MVISKRSDKQQQASKRRGSRRKNAHKRTLHYVGGEGGWEEGTKYSQNTNTTTPYDTTIYSQLIILIAS